MEVPAGGPGVEGSEAPAAAAPPAGGGAGRGASRRESTPEPKIGKRRDAADQGAKAGLPRKDSMTAKLSRSAPVRFASRFGRRVVKERAGDANGMLWACCAFAAAAECFNDLVTPHFKEHLQVRGVDCTGLFLNLSGAWLCGVATALGTLGPNADVLGKAFNGGFIAAYTSFCQVVEDFTDQHCAKNQAVLLQFVGCLLSGPFMFDVGHHFGSFIVMVVYSPKTQREEEPSDRLLPRLRRFLVASIVVAVAVEAQVHGAQQAAEVAIGIACVVAACFTGDTLATLSQEIMPSYSQTNWGTVFANAAALAGVVACEAVFPPSDSDPTKKPEKWLLLTCVAKFRASFLGALSAFGGFSQDAGLQVMAIQGNIDVGAANLGMNALVALVFAAVLTQVRCGPALF